MVLAQERMAFKVRFLSMGYIRSVPKMPLTTPDILWNDLLPLHPWVHGVDLECTIIRAGFIDVLYSKRLSTEHTHFRSLNFGHFLQYMVIMLFYFLLSKYCIVFIFLDFFLVEFDGFFYESVHKLGFLFMLRQGCYFLLDLLEFAWQRGRMMNLLFLFL